MQTNPPSADQQRLQKIAGRRRSVVIRISDQDHAELLAEAKRVGRTGANLALYRYEQGKKALSA